MSELEAPTIWEFEDDQLGGDTLGMSRETAIRLVRAGRLRLRVVANIYVADDPKDVGALIEELTDE